MSDVRLAGIDPFDALRGSHVPRWVRSRQRWRQMAIQFRKRLPLSTDALYGITPFLMAKTAACMLTAAARTGDETGTSSALASLSEAEGNLGGGAWGYEFDVQTRWAFYPAGSPNLIATAFAARGLGTADAAAGQTRETPAMSASAEFLSSELLDLGPKSFFRYTPTSERLVHNANLLGAGLVAMDGALTGRRERVERAVTCAMASVAAQNPDGSWPYGEGQSLSWSDNFHTAYDLDGLLQVWLASGDDRVRVSLERGVAHWTRDFFGLGGEPYYCPQRPHPYDIHSAGTAVDVASRLVAWGFGTGDLAERIAAWTERFLLDPRTGTTYYQRHRLWTDERHFIRWGDAHWALGRSSLLLMRQGRPDPLEAAVAAASGVKSRAR